MWLNVNRSTAMRSHSQPSWLLTSLQERPTCRYLVITKGNRAQTRDSAHGSAIESCPCTTQPSPTAHSLSAGTGWVAVYGLLSSVLPSVKLKNQKQARKFLRLRSTTVWVVFYLTVMFFTWQLIWKIGEGIIPKTTIFAICIPVTLEKNTVYKILFRTYFWIAIEKNLHPFLLTGYDQLCFYPIYKLLGCRCGRFNSRLVHDKPL